MKRLAKCLPRATPARRTFFFAVSDSFIIIFSLYFSFLLRFDFNIPDRFILMLFSAMPLFVLVKLLMLNLFRVYRITWRYAGLHDLVSVGKASILSQAALYAIIHSLEVFIHTQTVYTGFPRSVYIIDGAVSLLIISGFRASRRICLEVLNKTRKKAGLSTIIVGAGNIGETVLRDIMRQDSPEYSPAAFLDDDDKKIGMDIHGVCITGKIDSLAEAVKKYKAQAVIIAIPSLDYKRLREIYSVTRQAGIENVKIVPGIYSEDSPDIDIKKLENIKIEDIIGRQNVQIDFKEIEEFLTGKSVLVTGAGGSIGSEIVMQTVVFKPSRLVLLDIDETELHEMQVKLKKKFNSGISYSDDEDGLTKISFIVADVSDKERMDAVFKKFKPGVVFHAAANKHVPMMEENPEEAARVNVMGTYNLALAACSNGSERFIMISTDKAVKPKSIMGLSKRMAEYICKSFNIRKSCCGEPCRGTKFISVRFGNVLGSRGSILPLFLSQLAEGGPLTVTDKEMKRYFMTIPEAVSLVLEASTIGKGGDIMVLDMGEPVKITSLAEDLIKIHGLRPYKDIDIVFSGMRPGEKLFEEILTEDEVSTKHQKVFIAGNTGSYSPDDIEVIIGEFNAALKVNLIKNTLVRELLVKYAGFC
jgi:FlaA1/EpsC-like NDP-sugar epimerase